MLIYNPEMEGDICFSIGTTNLNYRLTLIPDCSREKENLICRILERINESLRPEESVQLINDGLKKIIGEIKEYGIEQLKKETAKVIDFVESAKRGNEIIITGEFSKGILYELSIESLEDKKKIEYLAIERGLEDSNLQKKIQKEICDLINGLKIVEQEPIKSKIIDITKHPRFKRK